MNQNVEKYIKSNFTYFKYIHRKYRYKGINLIIKDKAWSILSDYVRCRDFYRYHGACVSSGSHIRHWKEGDAGHYYSMSGHGAYLGFNDLNIHLQSKNENQIGSMETGARFRDTLLKRYGGAFLAQLELSKQRIVKSDDWFFIEVIENIYAKFLLLKQEFPNGDFPKYI